MGSKFREFIAKKRIKLKLKPDAVTIKFEFQQHQQHQHYLQRQKEWKSHTSAFAAPVLTFAEAFLAMAIGHTSATATPKPDIGHQNLDGEYRKSVPNPCRLFESRVL